MHSRYEPRLADASIAGQLVTLQLAVRRFFCDNNECSATTFVEQVEGLTTRHARRTPLLRQMLERIGLVLAGRAGSRLADLLGMPASRSTLLWLIRAIPDTAPAAVKVLGVDDFAFRRGHVYGSVLIDVTAGRAVDLLPDREADTFADWLRAHPGTEVICRDRAGAYADGPNDGAPDAVQVADRWHLWHNLAQHVEKAVTRHRDCLAEPTPEPEPDPVVDPAPAVDPDLERAATHASQAREQQSLLAARTRHRYEAVQALHAAGKGIKAIMDELGLAKGTVRQFVRAGSVEELLGKVKGRRPSILDTYVPYLHQRWNAGCTNALTLHQEIRDRGYRGRYQTLRSYLAAFRPLASAPPAPAPPVKVRTATKWILTNPANLEADDQQKLIEILGRCDHLTTVARHVTSFAKMLVHRTGEQLNNWIACIEADEQPELRAFTRGLKRDHAAVLAGLTFALQFRHC